MPLDNTASVEDLKAYNFTYSPRPSPIRDIINLSASKNIDNITLYNLLGQKIFQHKVNALKSNLNISNLPAGIYIMVVSIDAAVGTYKIIKK